MVRIEAGIHIHQAQQALAQQPRADGEDEGQRQFAHHQQVAQTAPGAAAGGLARLLQRVIRIGARGPQRGHKPEQDPGEQADGQGEPEHRGVHMNLVEARHFPGRDRGQPRRAPPAQQHAGDAAGHGQQQAFGQQLPDQPPARGAQRGA